MLKEFKEFINKGNVMGLAVAVIIGGAFALIVKSLVGDIIMPIVGMVTGGIDFNNLFISLDGSTYATLAEAEKAGAAVLKYGSFINAVINFIFIAFTVFLLVKGVNKSQKPEEEAAPTTKACKACTMQIPLEATKCPHCTIDQ